MIPPTFHVRRGYVHIALQVFLVALCVRLAVVQCLEHPVWAAKAEAMESDILTIEPQRGHILDRNGRRIAITTGCRSVFANPRAIPSAEREAIASRLVKLMDLDSQKVRELLSKQKYFVWIKRKVSAQEAEAVERENLPGVGFREESRRRYPKDSLLCHVLGIVGTDGRGLEGIEAKFDSLLGGTPGEKAVIRDGLGRRLAASGRPEKPVRDGQSLVLTIDTRVQCIVEEELAAACAQHRPESACAIVMDPRNGDVLAMAGWPTFDPGHFQESPEAVRRNMALAECLEPGSTFKPFVAAAALAWGVVTSETVFNCHRGRYRIGSRILHDAHGHGHLSVRDIVAYSSNIGMAQIGTRLGKERMYQALRAFGFGRPSGIELPGETTGILREPRRWSKFSVPSISMGQEVAVSPLQLVAGFCVFANGGWYVRPRIVIGVADADGRRLLRQAGSPERRKVLSRRIADLMGKDLLAGVVERGTARRCAIAGYRMAGKTGTAQIARSDGGGYEPGAYSAAFVGIVPADEPRFVIGLVAKKPSGRSHYGGVVAAPAVSRMAERILSMHRFPRAVSHSPRAATAVRRRPVRSVEGL